MLVGGDTKLTANNNAASFKGWLYKWTNYIKGYQKRYFVLSQGILSYYRSQNDIPYTCRGSINLQGAFIDTIDSTSFVVTNGGSHTFHLKATSEVDRQKWVTALELAKSRAIRELESDEEEQALFEQQYMSPELIGNTNNSNSLIKQNAPGSNITPISNTKPSNATQKTPQSTGSTSVVVDQLTLDLSHKLDDLITCETLINKHSKAFHKALTEFDESLTAAALGEPNRSVCDNSANLNNSTPHTLNNSGSASSEKNSSDNLVAKSSNTPITTITATNNVSPPNNATLAQKIALIKAKAKIVNERGTLFQITTQAVVSACGEFLALAQNQNKRWIRTLQHERDQKASLEQMVEQLAKQHNHLEKVAARNLIYLINQEKRQKDSTSSTSSIPNSNNPRNNVVNPNEFSTPSDNKTKDTPINKDKDLDKSRNNAENALNQRAQVQLQFSPTSYLASVLSDEDEFFDANDVATATNLLKEDSFVVSLPSRKPKTPHIHNRSLSGLSNVSEGAFSHNHAYVENNSNNIAAKHSTCIAGSVHSDMDVISATKRSTHQNKRRSGETVSLNHHIGENYDGPQPMGVGMGMGRMAIDEDELSEGGGAQQSDSESGRGILISSSLDRQDAPKLKQNSNDGTNNTSKEESNSIMAKTGGINGPDYYGESMTPDTEQRAKVIVRPIDVDTTNTTLTSTPTPRERKGSAQHHGTPRQKSPKELRKLSLTSSGAQTNQFLAAIDSGVLKFDPAIAVLLTLSRENKGGKTSIPHRKSIPDRPNMSLNLWNIIKNCIGKDLSKIPMPVNFSEPLSMLQRLTEDFEYSALLDRAAAIEDSQEQMCYVAAFTISSYSTTINRTSKPFNPLLGETYECDRSSDMGWIMISEQVSHHPPTAAFYTESAEWVCWQEFTMSSKFRGKYLNIIPLGIAHLKFKKSGNHYTWRKVTSTIHNIIVGKLWIEHTGDMDILNHLTKDNCHLKYNAYSYFTRESPRKVSGVVTDKYGQPKWALSGTWDSSIDCCKVVRCDDKNKETILESLPPFEIWKMRPPPVQNESKYNFTEFAIQLNEPDPKVAPTDSRKRPDQRLLEEGKWELANQIKVLLEDKQRVTRRKREEEYEQAVLNGEPHQSYEPTWFKKQHDPITGNIIHLYKGEYFTHKEKQDWSPCPPIYEVD